MPPRLTEVFVLREAEDRIKFLHPGTEVELLDRSPGAPAGGAWLQSAVRRRELYKDKSGKTVVAYEVSAPWTTAGTTDVNVDDYGKTWRLRDEVK